MDFSPLLADSELSVTPARLAVLSVLHNSREPIDISGIIGKIHATHPAINRVTVFRILNTFVERQLVTRLEFAEGKSRYELTTLPHHHHAVCVKCGVIQEIDQCDVQRVQSKVAKAHSFAIQSHRLEFFGVCQRCQA